MIGMSRVFGLQCQCALTNSILVFGSYHTIFGTENSIGVCFHVVYYTTRWRLHSSNNVIVHFFQVKKIVFWYLQLSLVFTLSSCTTSVKAPFPADWEIFINQDCSSPPIWYLFGLSQTRWLSHHPSINYLSASSSSGWTINPNNPSWFSCNHCNIQEKGLFFSSISCLELLSN